MLPKTLAKWSQRGVPAKMSRGGQTFSRMPMVDEYEGPDSEPDMDDDDEKDAYYAFGGAVPGIEHSTEEDYPMNPGDPRARVNPGAWSEERQYENDEPGRSYRSSQGIGDAPQKPIGRFAKGGKVLFAMALKNRR